MTQSGRGPQANALSRKQWLGPPARIPGTLLTRSQAKSLLALQNRNTLQGKRDFLLLSLMIGCALDSAEVASLRVEDVRHHSDRWLIYGLPRTSRRGKTVVVPGWVMRGIHDWTAATQMNEGRLVRAVSSRGQVARAMSCETVWMAVERAAQCLANRP